MPIITASVGKPVLLRRRVWSFASTALVALVWRSLRKSRKPVLLRKRVWSIALIGTCACLWFWRRRKLQNDTVLALLHRLVARHRIPHGKEAKDWTPIDCAAWLVAEGVLKLDDGVRLAAAGIDGRFLQGAACESGDQLLPECNPSLEKALLDLGIEGSLSGAVLVSTASLGLHPRPRLAGRSTDVSCGWHCGAARVDITGPVAEAGFFGYAKASQVGSGLLQRLYARAFCFSCRRPSTSCTAATFALVVCDLGCITAQVTAEVVLRLQSICEGRYGEANILICATHTHCSPGGLSCYGLYGLHPPLKGFDEQHFEHVVDGIAEAIRLADSKMVPAELRTSRGEVEGASINRSPEAYLFNPAEERALYGSDVNRTMTVLRIDAADSAAEPLGIITWFAVHPTSMSNCCTLVNGDNKGCAALEMEKDMRGFAPNFVAAFANSAEGDVSPNVWGPREGDSVHDLLRMRLNANQQRQAATRLWKEASQTTPLDAALCAAHRHVDFSQVEIRPEFQHEVADDSTLCRTCHGCIGMSMIGGSIRDGPSWALDYALPGAIFDRERHMTLTPNLQREQKQKRVILPSGTMQLTPEVLPLQVVLLGTFAVVAVPFETTTMAGRRLVRAALSELSSSSVSSGDAENSAVGQCVIAGLSNDYCGYMTTKEEYAAQHYEGASTHFGPNQLAACMQHVCDLCTAVRLMPRERSGIAPCDPGPRPPPPPLMPSLGLGVVYDNLPMYSLFTKFGGVRKGMDANSQYWAGHDVVEVHFWAGHPKNGYRPGPIGSFVEVQHLVPTSGATVAGLVRTMSKHMISAPSTPSSPGTPSPVQATERGGVWTSILTDDDIDTEFEWFRIPMACSEAIARWRIADTTPAGTYRLVIHGDYKSGWTGVVWPYDGASRPFRVINPVDMAAVIP